MSIDTDTDGILEQFTRYGSIYPDPDLVGVLWALTGVNDDLNHGRHANCVLDAAYEARIHLDRLISRHGGDPMAVSRADPEAAAAAVKLRRRAHVRLEGAAAKDITALAAASMTPISNAERVKFRDAVRGLIGRLVSDVNNA